MEIKMITGYTANYLGADGVSEVDMTDEQRINTWRYITHKLALKEPKGDDLNQLMQFCCISGVNGIMAMLCANAVVIQ